MSSIEMAVRNARAIESLLEQRLGATGKGLHEKLNSVQGHLPADIVKTARWIATLRNSAVHQDAFEIERPEDFMNAASRVISFLEHLPAAAPGQRAPSARAPVEYSPFVAGLKLESVETDPRTVAPPPPVVPTRRPAMPPAQRPRRAPRRREGRGRREGSGGLAGLIGALLLVLLAVLFATGHIHIGPQGLGFGVQWEGAPIRWSNGR